MKKSLLAALLLALLSAGSMEYASAQVKWVMDGAGCVPTDGPIKSDAYIVVAGRVKFKDPKVGSITLICPVSAGVGSVNQLSVSYRDATGTGPTARLQAALRRIDKGNGAVNTVTGLVFDSDRLVETQYTLLGSAPLAPHNLDDSKFYYFVQVTLTRSSSSGIVEFGGVELGLGTT